MYCYIDESGNTGLNLFDPSQPSLYYGILSSSFNLDEAAEQQVAAMRNILGVNRLHANELGVTGLTKIAKELFIVKRQFNINFDVTSLIKQDYAIISFFDQLFDPGVNSAASWHGYWTPLRYLILYKLGLIFNEQIARLAWDARICTNDSQAETKLIETCEMLEPRISMLPDARSQELIGDVIRWAKTHPKDIAYNSDSKKDTLQISPNLIAFQSVMHRIAARSKESQTEIKAVVVDRQTQFNKAQKYISELYSDHRNIDWETGPDLPKMDLSNMPKVPIQCTAGDDSCGLELVDIYLWLYKRRLEGRDLGDALNGVLFDVAIEGGSDEVSLEAIADRWEPYFFDSPEPSKEKLKEGRRIVDEFEKARQTAMKG